MAGDESLGRAVLALATDDSGLDSGLKGAEEKSGSWVARVGGTLGKGLAVGAGLAIGAGVALTAVLGDSVAAAIDAEQSQAQLDAVLRSTGGAAGMTKDAVNDLAQQLSEVTRFEDDAIVSGENMLLTFTNIGQDVFPAATQAMLDMSTATGQDMQSSAVQLGKALNDPIAGVSALTRVGVTFTEQQKEQIKAMQEAGDTAGAQKLILAELSKEFGGSAEAAGKTFAGQMDILNNALGNVKEEIGGALLPVLSELATKYGPALIEFAKTAAEWMTTSLIPAIETAAAWLGTNLPPAIETTKQVLEAIGRVIGDVVGWFQNMSAGAQAGQGAWGQLGDIIDTVVQIFNLTVKPAFEAVARFLSDHSEEIKTIVGGAWKYIQNDIQFFIDLIQGILKVALKLIQGDWSGAWEEVKATGAKLWGDINGMIGGLVTILETLLSGAWDRIKKGAIGAWEGVRDGINSAFAGALDGIKSTLNGMIDAVNSAISAFNVLPGPDIGLIPNLASGTLNFGGGLALVGEAGPEIVAMPAGSRVWPSGQAPIGATYNITINAPGGDALAIRTGVLSALDVACTRGQM